MGTRVMVATAALLAGTATFAGALLTRPAERNTPTAATPVASHAAPAAPRATLAPACRTAAPDTAHGYAAMFARVDPAQWGAADVSLSVPLADGRAVWLYGDTLSAYGFVHSSAIVQDHGCLHVSQRGSQLLPNESARRIYWIHDAHTVGRVVAVRARLIALTGAGPWDFRDAGASRTFYASADAAGDLTIVKRGRLLRSPAPAPGPLYRIGGHAHHLGYSRHAHPEARLASGRTLVTTCQNWDDGQRHPLAAYRPIFTER